jgi:putative adhesin
MNPRFSVISALLLTLAVAGPVAAQRDNDRDRGPRDTETIDRTLPMPAGGTLRLKTFSGRVKITGGSGDQLVVHAIRRATRDRLDDIKLEITQSGTTIEVDANHRLVERRNDNVVETDFEIQVPAKTRLDIKTFSAPVTVIGVSASQNIDGFSSEVIIESTEFGEGNDIDVNTFSGDVRLRLPATAKGNIDFNSFSGHFESDLPVTLNSSSRRNFRGALNGGGAGDFRLKTFSGDVSIRR